MRKKDFILSFIAGLGTAIFLYAVSANILALGFIRQNIFFFIIGIPIIFVFGFWFAAWLQRVFGFRVIFQFGKFAEVGFLNTAIDFGILNILIAATGITHGGLLAFFNVISFSAAVTNSYFWNRLWVFEDRADAGDVFEFFQFVVVTIFSVFLNTAIVYIGTTFVEPQFGLDPKTWVNTAKVFATIFSMVWNFVGYKFIVFKSK